MEEQVVNPDAVSFEESDEEQDSPSDESTHFSEAVLTATDWTVETILSQLRRENIFLSPRFQRRDAWTRLRKCWLMESLILGLPVPQIVLAEKKGERGKFIVLDGKQRLISLLQFVGEAQGKHNGFPLVGMEIARELEGKTFNDLSNDPSLSLLHNSFFNQTLRAVIIRNWPDNAFLHLVFRRLNTGSVKLSPQELRQALYPGEFTDFVDDRACVSPALKKVLRIQEPDFRMRDVELLVRYFAFRNRIAEYRGDLKVFLDETCNTMNRSWEQLRENLEAQAEDFERAVDTIIEIFGEENVSRPPEGSRSRRPFNRAIFDSLVYYFSIEDIGELAKSKQSEVREGFRRLWEKDPEFVKSVESTTKSIPATFKRLSAWGNTLKDILGMDVPVPTLEDNKIRA